MREHTQGRKRKSFVSESHTDTHSHSHKHFTGGSRTGAVCGGPVEYRVPVNYEMKARAADA